MNQVLRILLAPFMAMAALGFLASLAVHLATIGGSAPPEGWHVFWLHGGIFVVWLPAVLVAMRMQQGQPRSWRNTFAFGPRWMQRAMMGLFAYAILNFLYVFAIEAASPRVPAAHEDGSGSAVDARTLRGFSGHWMLFYGAGFAMIYAGWRQPARMQPTKCANGHPVAYSDKFCPACGVAIPERPS